MNDSEVYLNPHGALRPLKMGASGRKRTHVRSSSTLNNLYKRLILLIIKIQSNGHSWVANDFSTQAQPHLKEF
jgi:hypothetical protein